ncbi:MAG TPA: enoyl-CoA hydratase/isomerase family protein, partial [Myxococcota bacterium]|nr:enoyl-CoA hydratase/isomerase family protein [Myxococcota bacterium]
MGAELAEAIAELSQLAGAHPASPGRVTLRSEGRAGSLTLEHPEARNAVSIAMMRDLALAVEAALRAGLDTIVLRGAGAGFCAGGYLPEVRRALVEPEGARAMCAGMTAVLDALSASPALVIAAIDGPAVGGGVELALAADVRVIAPGAWMELRQARLGVTAGWGGAHRLVRRVGPGAALVQGQGSRAVI